MNHGLELHSGGILRALAHILNGKCFHLVKKKKKVSEFRFSWQHILRLKTVPTQRKPSRGTLTKGSLLDHQPTESKTQTANKFYAPGRIPGLLLLMSLGLSAGVTRSCISHRCPRDHETSSHPPSQHASHFFQVPL